MEKTAVMEKIRTKVTEETENAKPKSRRVPVTNVYVRNRKSTAKVVLNKGSAGSSKSHSIAQLIIQYFINAENKKILITRKTLPALRRSAYDLVLKLLKEYGYYPLCKHNKSELTIKYKTNVMHFLSLDDPEKIKSTDYNYEWLEEATDYTFKDFIMLEMRLRNPTTDGLKRQMFLSFNPIDQNHWIAKELVGNPKSELIESNCGDNPYLDPVYIADLKALKEIDYNMYRIYFLNEWGVLENIIYAKWKEISEELFDSIKPTDEFYGLDFGAVHATVLQHIKMKEDVPYIKEEVYEKKVARSSKVFTNPDLIERMKLLIPVNKRNRPIYADNSEPARIEEIYRNGFNVHPCDKGTRVERVNFCQRYTFHICGHNTIKEIKAYHRQTDKNGVVMANPVKAMDDTMDALEYGMFTHYHKSVGDNRPMSEQIKRSGVKIDSVKATGEQWDDF